MRTEASDLTPAARPAYLARVGEWLYPVTLGAIITLALLVRLVAVHPETLHVDEALYASFGRQVAEHRNLLLLGLGHELDRPPLFAWILGSAIAVFGDSPFTIRLPNLAFGVSTVALTCWLGLRIGAGWTGSLFAALSVALSPFAILMSASVFEEPGAVTIGLLALVLATMGRGALTGAAVAVAIAIKLFAALFFLPALALIVLHTERPWRAVASFFMALGFGIALLFTLMAVRTAHFDEPWFLTVQYRNIGGTGLVPAHEWPSRAQEWLIWIRFFAVGLAMPLVVLGVATAAARAVVDRHLAGALLIAFSLGYIALLTAVRIPIYDRYTLYILPAIFTASGAGLGWAVARWGPTHRRHFLGAALLSLTLVVSWPGAKSAVDREYPVAGATDHTYDGYRNLCGWLTANVPPRGFVWNRSLSWHLAYCLTGHAIPAYWYPDANAIATYGAEAYLALTQADDPQVLDELEQQGWDVTPVAEFFGSDGSNRMRIYHITPDGRDEDRDSAAAPAVPYATAERMRFLARSP